MNDLEALKLIAVGAFLGGALGGAICLAALLAVKKEEERT